MARTTKSSYIKAVSEKLRDNGTKKLLMFGKLDSRYSKTNLRDESGYRSTCGNILQVADNLWDACNGCDPVAEKIANFAQIPGYSDVSKVKTIGAIDVTIWNLANSIIPFIAIDRGMATPIDTIYYQNLIANNNAGNLAAGDQVYGNFTPPNTEVDLGLMSDTTSPAVAGAGADADVIIGTYAVPGQIKVTITDGTDVFEGQDFDPATGQVYFSKYNSAKFAGAVVDYAAHKVVISGLAAGCTATATWINDSTKDETGDTVLKVNSQWVPTQLITSPKQIILEQNLLNNAWMNKTYKFAGGTSGKDYADLAFSRMTDIYTEAMNMDVIRTLIGAGKADILAYHEANKVTTDFSTYDVSKFAQTKNDLISQFIISMNASFLKRTNVAPTVILSGTAGVALLSGNGDKWVDNPSGLKGLNGLAGYYGGIPVIRHNYFDAITPKGQADFYMATKFADNSVASIAFGEFLPLTNTGNINNFNNPIHIANGFFSVVGSQIIEKSLVQKGTVKLPQVMSI